MQTREHKNDVKRVWMKVPGNAEKARLSSNKSYLKHKAETSECKPDYGIRFNGMAVQFQLNQWGGQ